MAFDIPIIPPPQNSSAEIRHAHDINLPPPEERPLITALMPDSPRTTDVAQSDKIAANTDQAKSSIKPMELNTECFKSITLPSGWNAGEQRMPAPGYNFEADSPSAKDTIISVWSNGFALTPNDAAAVDKVFSDAGGKPKLLYDSSWEKNGTFANDPSRKQSIENMMKSIAPALGESRIGDNQFSNPNNKPPSSSAPHFHIDRAEVQVINGKQVLAIEGYYPDRENGTPARFFNGIYAPMKDSRGTSIHQVTLNSDDKMHFVANKAPFKKAVNSIVW